MMPIELFEGEYAFLSNFYMCRVPYEGIIYTSVEHAFQAAKAPLSDPEVRDWVADAATPNLAKRRGRRIDMRPDWDAIKTEVMYDIVGCKFGHNSDLKAMLLATGDAVLIEGNRRHDNFWGACMCSRCNRGTLGLNFLGDILTMVREDLQK